MLSIINLKPLIEKLNATKSYEIEKSVAITFAEGGILCNMIRCDYYLRLGVKR